MNPVCIYFVRHGQTQWNVEKRLQGWEPVPLNEAGVTQAKRAAAELKELSITAIYSSPVLRAKQTADIIAEPHKLDVRTDDGLGERNEGMLVGLTWEEAKQKYPEFLKDRKKEDIDWSFPEGESTRETIDRAWATFEKLAKNHQPGERIVMVSHGALMRALIHVAHGGKPEEIYHREYPDNAEIAEVHWDGKQAKIVQWKSKI